MRVLVVHNRYRVEGGEERSVELQLRALAAAGIDHALFERHSTETSNVGAATALLRGGDDPADLAAAVSALGADVVHVHNMQPLIGPRGLEAARETGARVVLHLHNVRLFCAIGVASRDGGPCFRCHHRNTLPGLALNCRDSLPEAAAYATALSLHQPRVLRAVDRFFAPSDYAAGQLARLGLPADRITVLPHYLPEDAFAERSRAAEGRYAVAVSRLSKEKGIDAAIEACARAGVPLKIAGDGPQAAELRALARGLTASTPGPTGTGHPAAGGIELLGRVDRAQVAELLAGAAMVLMPSRYHEFSPYAALEAAAAGVPVVATSMGGLPELLGPERCVAPDDRDALIRRVTALWESPDARQAEGDALVRRARDAHAPQRFTTALLDLYWDVMR